MRDGHGRVIAITLHWVAWLAIGMLVIIGASEAIGEFLLRSWRVE